MDQYVCKVCGHSFTDDTVPGECKACKAPGIKLVRVKPLNEMYGLRERFELVSDEKVVIGSDAIGLAVIRDKQTGVMYSLSHVGLVFGGLTPLLDKDGKPLTTFKVNI